MTNPRLLLFAACVLAAATLPAQTATGTAATRAPNQNGRVPILEYHLIGDKDGTYALSVEFHDHLTRLGIPHDWHPLRGVAHEPMRTLTALGEGQWEFLRKAFGETRGRVGEAAPPAR
mgnify:CR=1 FL=1